MILVAVDDLLFSSKIRATGKQVGAELTFARTPAEILEHARTGRPSMIIFDLNSAKAQPLETIAALKKDPATASIRTIGFVSHVHTALIAAARQAGADDVLARSAFAGISLRFSRQTGQRNPDHHRRHSPGGSAHQRPSLADAASSIRMAVAHLRRRRPAQARVAAADVFLQDPRRHQRHYPTRGTARDKRATTGDGLCRQSRPRHGRSRHAGRHAAHRVCARARAQDQAGRHSRNRGRPPAVG